MRHKIRPWVDVKIHDFVFGGERFDVRINGFEFPYRFVHPFRSTIASAMNTFSDSVNDQAALHGHSYRCMAIPLGSGDGLRVWDMDGAKVSVCVDAPLLRTEIKPERQDENDQEAIVA